MGEGTGPLPHARQPKPKSYLFWVSVVVVVVGPGTEVCCDVVVVLWVASDAHAVRDAMATTRAGMISFFMSMVLCWFVTGHPTVA